MLPVSTHGRRCWKTTLIPHETAIKTREFIANDLAAWASFQPLFDMISEKEPDLLD